MGLPKHIERELREAEEDFKAVYPDRVSETTAEEDDAKKDESVTPTEGETTQATAEADNRENIEDPDGYKHRYDVLKGKYNSEVPRLQTQIADLQREMQALKDAEPDNQTDETPSKVPDNASMSELREEYGDDFVDSIVGLVRESMGDLPDRIEAVETNTATSAFDRSCAELDRLKSGWRDTNDDPLFHAWLSEPDEMSGDVRQELLSNAFNNGDLQRVVRIFDAFEASQNQSQMTPNSTPTQPNQRRQMPDSNATGQQRDAKVYTTSEIDNFYADLTRGKYKGRESEATAIERDIFAAGREGRVVSG